MQKRIVIVDDDHSMRTALHEALRAAGYDTVQCTSGEEASQVVKREEVHLVISDVRMPGKGGLALLKDCRLLFPALPFVMISGHATVAEAVEAMKAGAYDFLVKPFSYRELVDLVEAALRQGAEDGAARDGNQRSGGGAPFSGETHEFITGHPRMLALLKFAAEVARSQASVLIHGESGTGKELLARFIHARSRRRGGPFVAVNCAALPEGLLESELFGYERGAFTGAVTRKPGKFELAHTGTLLLDEVSELPTPLQAKLLRVLQEREVDRVGGRQPLRVDIRVIATTNRDLRQMIRAGTFREDLFYRLNVIPLYLPPLRERIEDIELLAQAFFTRHGYKDASLSPQAVARLKAHPWRGNVRELFNVLERAAIVAAGEVIRPEHLLLEEVEGCRTVTACHPSPASPLAPLETGPAGPDGDVIRAGMSVQEMEERLIRKTLAQVNNNRTQAAKLLGITVRTLRNKLKQYQAAAHHGAGDSAPAGVQPSD
ncbi:MAG: sigma-54 dependent transcriptional regulator [Candidatus Binatia bacterium]|nr:sigma-54 dependent transcriptional regulator [Candidatus Binatia bacterium]